MKPSLMLNMIVRNESARIERCLASVLPFVKSVVVLDTGSTDNTVDLIADACQKADVPYIVEVGEFRDFSYARNNAWKMAKRHNGHHTLPWCQFALLVDADMELVVEDQSVFDLNALATSYNMVQKGGGISYLNRRIVNLSIPNDAIYVGVTHEYIDVVANGNLTGAHFVDYADGANRGKKYERDVFLLEQDLKKDPDNGRSLFYLGNSYMDWGASDPLVLPYASDAYIKRIKLGGWDEETHQSMMNWAFVEKMRGNMDRFVAGMVKAYSFRPSRSEPLYELAKFFRESGENDASLMFSKQGMRIPRPDDMLFVNDVAYSHGLRYEYSVAGYYDEKERNTAFQVTDDLSLDPTCPSDYRWSARQNLYWYTKPLGEHCPSVKKQRVHIAVPEGYTAMNPSIEVCNGRITANFRCVNYKIDEHGRYMIGPKECNDAPIDTRNFICKMDGDFNVYKIREVIWDRPKAKFPQVTGLEDIRLYRHKGDLWFNACVREQASNGTCQQWRGKLVRDSDDKFMLVSNDGPMSEESAIEKNWMPIGDQSFVYRLDTIIYPDQDKPLAVVTRAKIAVDAISGGSQCIPFRHGHLCVVHEAATGPDGKRTYWHRFAWLNHDKELRRLSLPFVFEARQIEFCAGLAYHPNGNDLILSYGVRDEEAHFATVNIEEVGHMIWKFHGS